MKRANILAAFGLVLTLGACSTGTQYDFANPGKLMSEMIDQRIQQIPYQHKDELYGTLVWLSQAGEQAIPALAAAFEHESPKVRSSIAWVFGRMGDRRTIPYLAAHKNESDPVVRLEVARSLLLLGDYAMVPDLIRGLNADMPHIRFLCYDALHTSTGKSFDYDHRAAHPGDREVAIRQWQDWWAKQSQDPMFHESGQLQRSEIGQPAAPQGR